MLKQLTNSLRDFKCGEIFCATPTQYSVNCCLCGDKVVFELFPAHFRSKHLGLEKPFIEKSEEPSFELENDPFAIVAINMKCETTLENEQHAEDIVYLDEAEDYYDENHLECDLNALEQEKCESIEVISEAKAKPKSRARLKSKRNRKACKQEKIKNCSLAEELIIEKLSKKAEDISSNIINDNQDYVSETSLDDANDDDWFVEETTEHAQADSVVEKVFTCSTCFEKCLGRKALSAHLKIHKEFKKSVAALKATAADVFKCQHDECNEVFPTATMLSNHVHKHNGITCEICGRSFTQISTLIHHRIRHTDKKDFACDECDYKAYTEKELRAHMICHTGILPQICDVCGKRCRNRGALTQHKRRHTGERPYKCIICGKGFFTGPTLKEHAVSHTSADDRPFECHCGVRAKTKKALRVHQKVHETEKPYECTQCGKKFAKERGLKFHMYSHDAAVVKSMKENTSRKKKTQLITDQELAAVQQQQHDPFIEMMQNLEQHINTSAT